MANNGNGNCNGKEKRWKWQGLSNPLKGWKGLMLPSEVIRGKK